MKIEVTAQEMLNQLREEYLKLEGEEAEKLLEKINFVQGLRNSIFYKKVRSDIINNANN